MNIYQIADYYFDVNTQQIQEMEYACFASSNKVLISHPHLAKKSLAQLCTPSNYIYSIVGGHGARIFEYKADNNYLSGVAIFNSQEDKTNLSSNYDAIVVYYDNEYLNEFIKSKDKEQNNGHTLRTTHDTISNVLNLLKHSAQLALAKSEKKELDLSLSIKPENTNENILKI